MMNQLEELKVEHIEVAIRWNNLQQDIIASQNAGIEVSPSDHAILGLLTSTKLNLEREIKARQ